MTRRPSTTSALAKATVRRNTSHDGISGPATSSAASSAPSAGSVRMSNLPRRRPAEQALWPECEHDRHDPVDYEQLGLGQEVDGESAGEPNQERADGGTCHATQSTDDAHSERKH